MSRIARTIQFLLLALAFVACDHRGLPPGDAGSDTRDSYHPPPLDLTPTFDFPPVPPCGRHGVVPTETLERVRYGFAAHWLGLATTPWWPPYPVEFNFRPDGTYSARCLLGTSCIALYYGTDAESPAKTYSILGLDEQGRGWGDIFFVWSDANSTKGELREIAFNTSLTEVSFKAYKGTYGPIVYELVCAGD